MNRKMMTALAAVAAVAFAAPPVWAAAPEQARAAAPAQTDGRYAQYPQYGYPTNQPIIAEAVIEHPEPRSVRATLGAVGDPFRALSVRFDDNGYDIVRSRARDDDDDDDRGRGDKRGWERGRGNKHGSGGYNGGYNGQGQIGSVQVDLSRYTQWMDGQREWFLRLDDNSNRGGYLRSFQIRTDAGLFQVQNVPAYFGRDRRLEARVLPRIGYYNGSPNGGGYPYPNGGGYPYPNGGGYPYPNDGGNLPGNVGIYRQMPEQAWSGQRVTLSYVINLPYGQASRVEVTENLPPSNWQIVRADPQPRFVDGSRRQVTWDIYQPRNGQRLTLELIVPQINGWQVFRGSYRFDGGQTANIAGYDRVWIGEGYQPGNYPRSRDRSIGDILTDIFGINPNG